MLSHHSFPEMTTEPHHLRPILKKKQTELRRMKKKVTFKPYSDFKWIPLIDPCDRDNVYGPNRPRQRLEMWAAEELNHVKLYMDVHQASRQNTVFYRPITAVMDCIKETCRHRDLC